MHNIIAPEEEPEEDGLVDTTTAEPEELFAIELTGIRSSYKQVTRL